MFLLNRESFFTTKTYVLKIREEITTLVHEFETSGQTKKLFSESKGIVFHKFNSGTRSYKERRQRL